MRWLCFGLIACAAAAPAAAQAPHQDLPYRDLVGRAEEFRFLRDWRSYYWREDFTFLLRSADGKTVRVISREPTPWNNLRLGTTFTDLKPAWEKKPRVRVIGVQGIDRSPAQFHEQKLDPAKTVTAFIVRVEVEDGKPTRDYFVNNWFHRWGAKTDRMMLQHHANRDARYTVYGFVGSNVAPFDAAGQARVRRALEEYSGIIYHARVVKADNAVGYELQLLHLMGRHKKSASYRVFFGDEKELMRLDQKAPTRKVP